ncbi:hypothetical protein ACFLTZ_00610 [Chloroflexota bacterium]
MNFESHRPQGYIGKVDRYLPKITEDLTQVLIRAQEFAYHTLYLPSRKLEELATVLIEFAEDCVSRLCWLQTEGALPEARRG